MTKTTPTERLTSVLVEALTIATAHKTLQNDITRILQSWGQMPDADTLASIREALDRSLINIPSAIPDAVAYLRLNGAKIASAREAKRRQRGAEPIQPFNPTEHLPVSFTIGETTTLAAEKPMSLEDIEAKLKGLDILEEDGMGGEED